MPLSPALHDALSGISTTTIATLLAKSGRRSCRMRGPRPLANAALRLVGPAFTLRFIPTRDAPDVAGLPASALAAIEAMPAGAVAVAGIGGAAGAGTLDGVLCDFLATRLAASAVAGLVTDGAVRDGTHMLNAGMPVWAAGIAARPSASALTLVSAQDAVACGGVAVMPGDIVVADHDGAVVIPADRVGDVVRLGQGQALAEAWILSHVGRGIPLPGLHAPASARPSAEQN